MVVGSRNTLRSVSQVLRHAVNYFGPEGVGLEVEHEDIDCVRLHGGACYVTIRAYARPATGLTTVEVEACEKSYIAERFLGIV